MIQTQKLTPLPPASELGAKFCQWFSHGWHWIYGATPAPGQKIQWFTETRYPLEPRNLWQEYQDSDKIIGLRFDNHETRYCLIDIDRSSPYHPANNRNQFNSVLAGVEAIGLCRPLLIRSSDSEGIHIYYFLPEPAPTFSLACAIRFALEDAGLSLRPGWLETFPNCKAYSPDKPTDYNGHRLPLQAGSYWLDSDGLPMSNNLAQFLDAADLAATNQDIVALRKALAAADKNRHRLKSNFAMSQRGVEFKHHLEQRIKDGWSAQGQTNVLLKDFATYGVFCKGLSGSELINFVVATAQAAPGYERWCRHQHEIYNRAADWSRAAERWYSPYRSFPKRNGRTYRQNFEPVQNNIVNFPNQHNVRTHQLAAERIQQAMDHLKATNTLPYGATARAAVIIATLEELTGKGISPRTLYKDAHLPIWHPEHQKSPEPAQGKTLYPVLEVDTREKSPEPAQGETLYPTPLYEGIGANALHPEPPSQGAGVLQGIVPSEYSGEREGENAQTGTTGTTTPATSTAPATPTAPIAPAAPIASATMITPATSTAPVNPATPATPTAPDAPATPAALTAPANPTNTSGSRMPLPPGASQEEICKITKIWLAANAHAKNVVKWQEYELGKFEPAERDRRKNRARMQFLWDSGEPVWMYEVERWQAANPSVELDLSSPGDKSLTGGAPPV